MGVEVTEQQQQQPSDDDKHNDDVEMGEPHEDNDVFDDEDDSVLFRDEKEWSVHGPPPLSAAASSASSQGAPPPPQLARARARIIAMHPGAVHMPGILFSSQGGTATRGPSDDDIRSMRSGTSTDRSSSRRRTVLVHAELAVQPPALIEATVSTFRPPLPTPELHEMHELEPPKPLVHAEPLQERKITFRDLWNNRTIRIFTILFVLVLVFVVGIVIGLIVGLEHNGDRNSDGVHEDYDGPFAVAGGHHDQPPVNETYFFNVTYYNSTELLTETGYASIDGDAHPISL